MVSPDIPVSDRLLELEHLNPGLARELSRLPELTCFKTRRSTLALEHLLTIYRACPARFDRAFGLMHEEGLPGKRAYCSPLQALFWMVQDGKIQAAGRMVGIDVGRERDGAGNVRPCQHSGPGSTHSPYKLSALLDAAWNGEAISFLTPCIPAILAGIKGGQEAEEYALMAGKKNIAQIQGYIMDDFLTKPAIFLDHHKGLIKRALAQSRWKRFESVADRLNSPGLVSYYINRYFFFRKIPSNGVYFTFWNKKAQCTDAAYFTQFMLTRAGYQTFIRSVKWNNDPWDGLHTGAGIILENGDYLLVSNYTGTSKVCGPYSNVDKLDDKISCGRKIIHRQWGAYFPPRYF